MSTGSFAQRLWPGLNHFYGDAYKARLNEFEKIFDIRQSDKRYELAVQMSSLGLAAQKNEGGTTAYDYLKQVFTTRYENVMYSQGVAISHELLEDDQYSMGPLSLAMEELNRKMKITKETLGANVLINAFSSSYLGGDGVALGSASHKRDDGGTFSNVPTTPADLSEAALEQSVIDIAKFVDQRGILIAAAPKRLIFGINDIFNQKRILGSDLRSGTTDNDLNALKTTGMIPDVALNHYLSGNLWFIITDIENGLIHFSREAYRLDTNDDFDTMNTKVRSTERFCFGWSNPLGVYCVNAP